MSVSTPPPRHELSIFCYACWLRGGISPVTTVGVRFGLREDELLLSTFTVQNIKVYDTHLNPLEANLLIKHGNLFLH